METNNDVKKYLKPKDKPKPKKAKTVEVIHLHAHEALVNKHIAESFAQAPDYIHARKALLEQTGRDSNSGLVIAHLQLFFNYLNKIIDENVKLKSELQTCKQAQVIKLEQKQKSNTTT